MGCVKGSGQLKHHFWGTYSATIAVAFTDEASARDALVALGNEWELGEKNRAVVVWYGEKEAFNKVKALLISFGADGDKIDSCKYSIDYGEPFEVKIPVQAREQEALF